MRVPTRRPSRLLPLAAAEQLVDHVEAGQDREAGGLVHLGLLAHRADLPVEVLRQVPDVLGGAPAADRDPLAENLDLGSPLGHRRLLPESEGAH